MTCSAVARGRVIRILCGRRSRDDLHTDETLAALVAGRAAGADPGVIHRRAGTEPGRRRVACRAVGRGRYVTRALRNGCHADKRNSASACSVTRGATAADAGVVHDARLVARQARVTQRARLGGRDVVCRQDACHRERARRVTGAAIAGRRVDSILRRRGPGDDGYAEVASARLVARCTSRSRNRLVVHRRAGERREVRRGVACLARNPGGGNVVWRRRLDAYAEEILPRVVARRAGAHEPGVIHRGACKGGRLVASVAGSFDRHVSRRHAARRGSVVAAGAGSGRDSRVTETRPLPSGDLMAAVAGRRGHHVVGGLSRRRRAVVARQAGPGANRRVIERRARPQRRRPVARIAGLRRHCVSGRLSRCLHAVVARGARPGHRIRVIEFDAGKADLVMANGARLGYHGVARRHRHGADSRAGAVTGRAILRRALEHAANVAALAARDLVRAAQRKPGRQVLLNGARKSERALDNRRIVRRLGRAAEHHDRRRERQQAAPAPVCDAQEKSEPHAHWTPRGAAA